MSSHGGHASAGGDRRRSSTRAEVLRAMAASSYEANDSEGRRGGGDVDVASDRARANRTMSADINMSNRLNHLVRAEEAELQQLGIIDSDSPRYAQDINRTGSGIGGQGKSALAREDPNAGHPAGPRWMDSPNGKQPASASPAVNRTSLSGLHSSLTSMFGSATGIRQFLKTPVTTPAFVKCRLIREKDQHISSDTFHSYMLYYEEGNHLLLTARRCKKGKRNPFVVSVDANDLTERSSGCVAKIHTNFTGSTYSLIDEDVLLMRRRLSEAVKYASPGPRIGPVPKRELFGVVNDSDDEERGEETRARAVKSFAEQQQLDGDGMMEDEFSQELGFITFKSSSMKLTGGPRELSYVIPKPGANAANGEAAAVHGEGRLGLAEAFKRSKAAPASTSGYDRNSTIEVLRTKKPEWSPKQGSYVLDFNGRVNTPSVKNFQLIHANVRTNQDELVLQFGKVDTDDFILDFRYPLNPLQAFAVAISAMDGKLTTSL